MAMIERIYFPRWVAWFFIVILLPIVVLLEYEAFFGNSNPIIGELFGFIFVMIIVMTFLVSYRKIPYMIIEKQQSEPKKLNNRI